MPGSSLTHPQAFRQLKMRRWLLDGRRFNASQAADEFQVSRRTIAQDIEQMRAFGHAIEYNAATRSYELTEESGELPVPQIRRSEVAAIMLAQEVFETFGAEPMADAAARLVERVRELAPDLLDNQPGAFTPALRILRGPAPEGPLPWLEDLTRCIDETRTVRIRYFTMYRNAESTREIDPYHLLSRDGRGYVVGWCHDREDVLIFRLDRIRELEPTKVFFDVRGDFDLREFLGPMFGIFKDREPFRVKVRFSPWVARWIKEEKWHDSQTMTDLPDGSVQVDLTVTGHVDVRRWVLSFGGDAEVLEPDFLRREIREEMAKMQATYAE